MSNFHNIYHFELLKLAVTLNTYIQQLAAIIYMLNIKVKYMPGM